MESTYEVIIVLQCYLATEIGCQMLHKYLKSMIALVGLKYCMGYALIIGFHNPPARSW
jgi:hypothetical protein